MPTLSESTDETLLTILRRRGSVTVAELSSEMDVTATAVRQRLTRLSAQGLVERVVQRQTSPGRGRPTHAYSLTAKARRLAGDNYADLASILWDEIRSVKDADVRRGLLQRLSKAFVERYRGRIRGATTAERMQSLKELFAERRIPLAVVAAEESAVVESAKESIELTNAKADEAGANDCKTATKSELPILRVEDCPYPELAAQDRGICAMEKMIFAELVDDNLRLTQCRLDGHTCCEFSA